MSKVQEDAQKLINYVNALEKQGALFLSNPQEIIPPTAGLFNKNFPAWEPNHEYKKNDLFIYDNTVGYVKQSSLTSQEIYPPFSTGTEALYGARPKPDVDGIYPYVYNMGIFEGMKVYGTDGIIYKSISGTYENPTELFYPPEQAVSLFVKDGEETPTEPEEPTEDEYTAWVQPTGAHDAYSIGAKVIYNGKKYISQIEGNTTVPGLDERWWKEVVEN